MRNIVAPESIPTGETTNAPPKALDIPEPCEIVTYHTAPGLAFSPKALVGENGEIRWIWLAGVA